MALFEIRPGQAFHGDYLFLHHRSYSFAAHEPVNAVCRSEAVTDGVCQAARLDYISCREHSRHNHLFLGRHKPVFSEALDLRVIGQEFLCLRCFSYGNDNLICFDKPPVLGVYSLRGDFRGDKRPDDASPKVKYAVDFLLKGRSDSIVKIEEKRIYFN